MRTKLLFLFIFLAYGCYAQAPNTWVQKANFSGGARHYATGLSIGTKGYTGTGYFNNGTVEIFYNDFWEYDQVGNTWTQKANFGGTARYWAVGFSIGTKGYIGTGFNAGGDVNDFWEYDQSSNTWTQKANFGGTTRENTVGFAIGTRGYIGVGFNGTLFNDFWEWNQGTNTWARKSNFGGTPRFRATGFSIGTKGYIGTGLDSNHVYRKDFWEYDRLSNTWSQKANFGGTARESAVGFAVGSKGFIGTGIDDSIGYTKDFWEYDQGSNIWTQKANFGGTARVEATGFSIGNKGYVGTGDDGISHNDFWEYTPDSIYVNNISLSTLCAGSNINISYSTLITFNNGNIFTAQLSNASGSFASPVNIGSLASTNYGTINAVIPASTVAGSGYRIRVISSNPVTIGTDNGSNITITPGDILNLKFLTQGYYINGGTMKKVLHNEGVDPNPSSTKVDTVVIELHNATSPFAVVESYKGVLQTNDSIACYFSCNITGHSYYIVVKHRNTVQTWSAAPVAFTATTNYDFTTAANKAYGNKMVQMQAGVWAFYTGDINQDENVDLLDFPTLDFGINRGLTGYYASDLNGDGNVDLLDFPMFDTNVNAGIYSVHP